MTLTKKTLLATTFIAGLTAFAPSLAFAQSQAPQSVPPAEEQDEADKNATQIDEVVVTGSRIRRTNAFTSTQPIQQITSEEATLEGLVDTTEILQNSTAANTATQINNNFTGFVTTGGPGVNTISLRGLGEQRTLVLINGRRVGPAGVRGTVGPTDLNTIPGGLIERIDILLDGASSIYGSDAVAGVVNFISKTNLDGGNVDVFVTQPFEEGGEEYQASATYGRALDRSYFSVGAFYYERKELLYGDREEFACPQDRVYADPDLLTRRDVEVNGSPKCVFVLNGMIRNIFAGSAGPVLPQNRRDGDYRFSATAVQGGGFVGCDAPGFQHVAGGNNPPGPSTGCSIFAASTAIRRAAYADYPLYNDRYVGRTAISPVQRYSISAFGGFDLTPNIELFGELLLNRRESEQKSFRQLFPTVSPFHTNNPFGGPFNGQTNSFNGGYFAIPVALVNTGGTQQVDYARAVVGLKGSFDLFSENWDWELAAQYSLSEGTYGGAFFYNDRVEATAGLAALFGEDANGNRIGGRRPFGAVNGNCDAAILISATTCPTGGVNYFSQAFIEDGVLPADQMAFILGFEEGTTRYEHKYVEGVVSGDLFDLPAGPLGVALGFHVRREEIDDNPGPEQQRGNLWGQTAAGRTRGSDQVRELFAEFEVPLIKNAPLMDSVTINLSGRLSDYDSYGENSTYKVGLNWRITPEFRLRVSNGTSFRAPALYELFLANQTSFLGQGSVDPCINYQNSTNPTLQANCAADGVPPDYTGLGSSATITTGGGLGILRPETAEATTVGLIWTPSFIDLSFAVDYFEFRVNDQIDQFGAGNIVNACYTSQTFPNDPLCTLFVRDKNSASPRFNQILSVNDSYVNIAEQQNRGLDFNLRYRREFSFGDLTLNGRVSHILDQTQQTFGDSAPTIITGRIGAPETVGNASARFDRGDWTIAWNVDYVGETDNDPFFANTGNDIVFLGEPVFVERGTPDYFLHSLTVRRVVNDWTFLVGIRNLFDENPPLIGTSSGTARIGDAPLVSQYDLTGRRLIMNIAKSF